MDRAQREERLKFQQSKQGRISASADFPSEVSRIRRRTEDDFDSDSGGDGGLSKKVMRSMQNESPSGQWCWVPHVSCKDQAVHAERVE